MKTTLQILIIAIFSITFTTITYATNSKKIYSGYVVTNNGDTIHGKIQMLSPTLNEVKVKLIANNKTQTFKAKEVQAYSFVVLTYKNKKHVAETITYVRKTVEEAAIPFGSKNVLVEQQVKGEVSLYNHYVETRAGQNAFKHSFYVEKGTEMVKVTRENFKKAVKNIVADYPELSARVGKKGYGYKYIAKIITEYNNNKPKNGQFLGMN